MANASPEPFSNWGLSFAEDGVVLALGLLALTHPVVAGVVAVAGVVIIVAVARWLVRGLRRRLGDNKNSF
jgi:hypothetical protein